MSLQSSTIIIEKTYVEFDTEVVIPTSPLMDSAHPIMSQLNEVNIVDYDS